eukprot:2622661-Alexandrium_andersonii.AAC.1
MSQCRPMCHKSELPTIKCSLSPSVVLRAESPVEQLRGLRRQNRITNPSAGATLAAASSPPRAPAPTVGDA